MTNGVYPALVLGILALTSALTKQSESYLAALLTASIVIAAVLLPSPFRSIALLLEALRGMSP